MVNLGLIKDAGQSPDGTPRVYLRRNGGKQAPTIRAWNEKKRKGVELLWHAPSGDPNDWAEDMAAQLTDLSWTSWRLDAHSVAATLGTNLQQGLELWGSAFWPYYRRQGRVYLQVGDDGREAALAAIERWQATFSHVNYNERLDIDLQIRQKAEELKDRPIRRTLSKLFPWLISSL